LPKLPARSFEIPSKAAIAIRRGKGLVLAVLDKSRSRVKMMREATLDGVAKALHRFETYTRFRDFQCT
jgi:hypothetical protein